MAALALAFLAGLLTILSPCVLPLAPLVVAASRAQGLAGPLALAALGGALILTGAIGRPPDRRLFLPGILLFVGSAVAVVVERGLLPGTLMAGIAPYWWVVAAVVVVVWLLPVVFGRRS